MYQASLVEAIAMLPAGTTTPPATFGRSLSIRYFLPQAALIFVTALARLLLRTKPAH